MSKRKKTDIVSLKLRIRETLRKRIETAAKAERNVHSTARWPRGLRTRSIELGIVELLEALLAPGDGLELLRAIATVLRMAGPDWGDPPKSVVVADAINKVVAVFTGELPAVETSFPHARDQGDR